MYILWQATLGLVHMVSAFIKVVKSLYATYIGMLHSYIASENLLIRFGKGNELTRFTNLT